jgi:glucokinase
MPAAQALGIGSAGDIDPNTGCVVFATDSIPAWAGTPLRTHFETALDLPVAVDNDGNAMALGEARFGAARGGRHVIGLTVGTGIGGGLILDGRVFHGRMGVAGAAGHIVIQAAHGLPCVCGGRGCLEMYASGPAIETAYQRLRGTSVTGGVKALQRLAEAGDDAARLAIAGGASALGVGIASLLNLLNPDCVVIAGGVAQLGEPYLEQVRAAVHLHAKAPMRDTPILPSALGVQANLIGAAALAWDRLDATSAA